MEGQKKEYLKMVIDIWKLAETEYYCDYKYTLQVPSSIYYLAEHYPEGRDKYLKKERFKYMERLRSNTIAQLWLCGYNCCDIYNCDEFITAVADKLHYFHNIKKNEEDIDVSLTLANLAKKDLKEFFIEYFRIKTIDRWINNTTPKPLPEKLLKDKSRFDSVERLLIANGWIDPIYRWVLQDSNKELHYLLFILAKHGYFNGIIKTKKGDLSNENRYSVLLSPLLDRWQFSNKDNFIRDYLKHSKFSTATPPKISQSGDFGTFAFLNLKPM